MARAAIGDLERSQGHLAQHGLLVRGRVREACPPVGVVAPPALHEPALLALAHEPQTLFEHVLGHVVRLAELVRDAFRECEHGSRGQAHGREEQRELTSLGQAPARARTRCEDRRGSARRSDPIRTGRACFEATPARAGAPDGLFGHV